ncbi:hypothetical protein [Coleofasciculus sp. E1-EBD-02]|uniref:hypothetical protein n=1 Tax=Coleofasciculus sp. E1-EBD-02 TaxID=3068481 RepID=UPI0032F48AAB
MDNTLNRLRRLKRIMGYRVEDTIRHLSNNVSPSEIVNQKEIRVVGLKRSGNHAIINWIRKQHHGEVWHLNKIPVKRNPYRFLYEHYPKETLKQEAKGNFTKKDCLIYSYEDHALEQITDKEFDKKSELYLGESAIKYDVIILRDPFNMLASRFKKGYMKVKCPDRTLVELWISYAQELLEETQLLKNNKIVINYNQWFIDVDYRQQLAKQLNIKFSDAGFNDVKGQGGGSSFDGIAFRGKAAEMDILNRWKVFADQPQYQKLIDNTVLRDYSERIFGHIPGTERYF